MADQPIVDSVTIVLRGYFSRRLPDGIHAVTLPLTRAATPRAALAELTVPLDAIGLVLVNKEQASLDTPLCPGDAVDILPLMGGG
jgi:hypothetical protein